MKNKLSHIFSQPVFILLLLFFSACHTIAQSNPTGRVRIYKTWVTGFDQPTPLKGAIFEVKDSSFLISNSLFKNDYLYSHYTIIEMPVRNIDVIKLRNKNSIEISAGIGAVAGYAGAIAITNEILKGSGNSGAERFGYSLLIGSILIPSGALLGALIGTTKAIIPINGNQEEFNANRYRLQKYSIQQEPPVEKPASSKTYRHRSYFGYVAGPSFPLGTFSKSATQSEEGGSAKTGGGGCFTFGFRISPRLGVGVFLADNQFDLKSGSNGRWWGIGNLMAGPMYSVPLPYRLYLDCKLLAGFADAQRLTKDGELEIAGNGLGLGVNTTLAFNFSKRWGLMLEPNYCFSGIRFDDGSRMNIQSLNLDFGIAFRFR